MKTHFAIHRGSTCRDPALVSSLTGGILVALALGGCDMLNPKDSGGAADVRTYPDAPFDPNTGECATNWRPLDDADLGSRARVENERLVMRSEGGEVAVQGLLGVPPGGRGAVLRFDFYALDLGPDGRFELEMVSPEGRLSQLVVEPSGATLTVEAGPHGEDAELVLASAPGRMVFELDLQPTMAVEARAYFFEAGRGKVLASGVPRFAGGTVTNVMRLSGARAEVKLERFARIDPGNGGLMEDFWCDSLGPAADRFRFPEGRASKAGNPCGDDDQCGAGELCVANFCRRACLASSQCLSTVCIVTEENGLCAVPGEDCSPSSGLTCGSDGALRNACQGAHDCPRPDDLCLGGACVSNDEPWTRDGDLWGTCEYASERCEDDAIESCDTEAPGWNVVERCAAGQCKSDGRTAFCDACVRSCGGLFDEDVLASCDGGAPTLDKDCRDGFEVCSLGDAADQEAHCRPVVPSAPPSQPVAVASGYAIDPTEVTRAQYAAFLQTNPSIVSQGEDCAWNQTFRPQDWPWFDAPERAVQVDYCDAVAYCTSVGKSLCSPTQWHDTCSAGGEYDFPYGDTYESGRCSIDPRRDVASDPECTAQSGPYAGVYDMIGGVGEWVDHCAYGPTTVRAADSCKTRGTSVSQSCEIERTVRRDSIAGIRCCAL